MFVELFQGLLNVLLSPRNWGLSHQIVCLFSCLLVRPLWRVCVILLSYIELLVFSLFLFPFLPVSSRFFPFLPVSYRCFPFLTFSSCLFPFVPISSRFLLVFSRFFLFCFFSFLPISPGCSPFFPFSSRFFPRFFLFLPLLPVSSRFSPFIPANSNIFQYLLITCNFQPFILVFFSFLFFFYFRDLVYLRFAWFFLHLIFSLTKVLGQQN